MLERTQAQKRHLESLMLAKSAINTRSTYLPRSTSLPHHKNQQNTTNLLLIRSITAQRSTRLKQRYVLAKSQLDFTSNLSSYSSLTRNIKQRQIEQENSKLLLRIVTAAPSIKRKNWAKMQQQHERYK